MVLFHLINPQNIIWGKCKKCARLSKMYISLTQEKGNKQFSIINIISALCHVTADTYLKHKPENNQKREQKSHTACKIFENNRENQVEEYEKRCTRKKGNAIGAQCHFKSCCKKRVTHIIVRWIRQFLSSSGVASSNL